MVVLVELNIRFVHRTGRKQVNIELECHAPCVSFNGIYVLSWEFECSREEGVISLADLTPTVLMLTQTRTWIYNIMCFDHHCLTYLYVICKGFDHHCLIFLFVICKGVEQHRLIFHFAICKGFNHHCFNLSLRNLQRFSPPLFNLSFRNLQTF